MFEMLVVWNMNKTFHTKGMIFVSDFIFYIYSIQKFIAFFYFFYGN